MTYFKLNIPRLNDEISLYKQARKNCLDDIGIVYRGLGYTESAWNDSVALTFIEKLKGDKFKTIEYFNHLDSLYSEIEKFKSNINDICYKYGYRNNSVELKFDDSELSLCKTYLSNAIYYLNCALNQVKTSMFSVDFLYLTTVYNIRSEIKKIKNLIDDIESDISNLNKFITDELSDSKFRMKKLTNYAFNLKPSEFKWKTQTFSGKNDKVSTLNNQYHIDNKIDLDKSDTIQGLNNSVINNVANLNEINKLEDQNIDNLATRTNQYIGIDHTTDYEKADINANYLNSANTYIGKDTDIDYERIEVNNNYLNNANTYSAIDNNIDVSTNTDFKNNTQTFEQKDNTLNTDFVTKDISIDNDEYKLNDNNINLSSVQDIKTNIDVKSYDSVDNNTNMDNIVSNTADFSGVKSYDANTTNIDTNNIVSNKSDLSNIKTFDSLEQMNVKTNNN